MYQYLKDKSAYVDLYDLHTIEECLRWFNLLKSKMEKHRTEFKPVPPYHTDFDHEVLKACSYTVNAMVIDRYQHKNDTIIKWMERDKGIQDLFDSASPLVISCDKCGSQTKVIDKHLHSIYDKDPKVSFVYECISCKFRKILYADGSKWDYEKPRCPKCNSTLENKYKKTKNKLTTLTTCAKCSYKEIDVIDFEKNRLDDEKEEKRKADLFKKWRTQFCLTDANGPDAVARLDNIGRIVKEWKERDKKEKDPVFQQVKNLKILKINQLKEIINKSIVNHDYTDLQFGQPEMGKFVIISFTATDKNDKRAEYDSTNTLRKLIMSSLENTNWRLMSEGVQYRLGIVSGRLKAYEQEDDLMELIKAKE